MSLNKVEQLKSDKGFRPLDLIIYGVTAVLIAVLFIVFFATGDRDPLHGIKLTVKNQTVFECDFDGGGYSVLRKEQFPYAEERKEGDILTLTVRCSETEYNVVEIDLSARRVRVTESNCRRGDCGYTALNPLEITSNSSRPIICLPHGLIIEPYGYSPDYDDPNVIV